MNGMMTSPPRDKPSDEFHIETRRMRRSGALIAPSAPKVQPKAKRAPIAGAIVDATPWNTGLRKPRSVPFAALHRRNKFKTRFSRLRSGLRRQNRHREWQLWRSAHLQYPLPPLLNAAHVQPFAFEFDLLHRLRAIRAFAFFKKWYGWAIRSRLAPIKRVARTLKARLENIVSYFRHRITNASAEGLNSKIQSLKSAARGFRNFFNYRTRILFFCGKLDLAT